MAFVQVQGAIIFSTVKVGKDPYQETLETWDPAGCPQLPSGTGRPKSLVAAAASAMMALTPLSLILASLVGSGSVWGENSDRDSRQP